MEPSTAPELYCIAQFVVDRLAADALDLSRITRELRDAGMVAPNIEMNRRRAGANKVRVTCRTLVALRLIAEWKRVGEGAPHTDAGAKLRDSILVATTAASVGCYHAWAPRPLSMGDTGYLGA